MFDIMEIFGKIVDSLINSIYIGLLAYAVVNACYKFKFDTLKEGLNALEVKQEILYDALIKLKKIYDLDNKVNSVQTRQLKEMKMDILLIKKNKQELKDSLSCEESDETEPSPKNKPTMPIQNHITFPNFFILNRKNFKQKPLTKDTYEINFTGFDLRLASNQLAKFLKVKCGTCIEFDEAFNLVHLYIENNNIVNISENTHLCKLFGITEYEDYEFLESIPIAVLKKMLDPHLKKISCNGL